MNFKSPCDYHDSHSLFHFFWRGKFRWVRFCRRIIYACLRYRFGRQAARVDNYPYRTLSAFRRVGLITIVLVACIFQSCKAPATSGAPSGRASRGAGLPASVAIAPAKKGDIRVFVTGIGSVAPLSTVTVRSLVDGKLMSVNFEEGRSVAKGSLLAIIDPRPFEAQLMQAAGQLQRDSALLTNARLDLQRYDTLWAQDAIARQQYDTQKSLVAQLEGTVRIDQGLVENAKLQLGYTRITSPIDGRVGLKSIDPGNIVHTTDANGLAVITQLRPIAAVFSIPEDNLPRVLEKFAATKNLAVEAYNRSDSVKLAEGRLSAVDNRIDSSTGTVRLKAVFSNTDNKLFPDQFVNIHLLLDVKHDQIIVAQAAVQRGPQGTYVYRVQPDHTVTVVLVTAGLAEGDNISIDAGLSEGDSVVIDGADKLREGSLVESNAAAAHGNASSPHGKKR